MTALGSMLLGASPAAAALVAPRPLALAAGPADVTAPAVVELDAQAARLRAELGKVNAEITALKRGDRGVRDDYRLRSRMADAEQLARKLTTVEADLRRLRAPAAPARVAPAAPAIGGKAAAPAEAPAVLEARADLLADEARRLTLRAGTLERAADQLRNRQSLRRRAGHLERDPFAVMEGSKRFMVVPGAPASRNSGQPGTTGDTAVVAPTSPGTPTNTSNPENSMGAAGAPVTPPQPPPTATPGVAPPGNPGASNTPTTATTSPTPQTTPQPAPPAERGGGAPVTDGKGTGPTNLSGPGSTTVVGSRALLDPDTVAELRRLESASAASNGRPMNEVERLQQAAAILARKAQALESQARALRARAQER